MDLQKLTDYYKNPKMIPLDPESPLINKGKTKVGDLTVDEVREEIRRFNVTPLHYVTKPGLKPNEIDTYGQNILATHLGLLTLCKWLQTNRNELVMGYEEEKLEAMKQHATAVQQHAATAAAMQQLQSDKLDLQKQLVQKCKDYDDLLPVAGSELKCLDTMDMSDILPQDE